MLLVTNVVPETLKYYRQSGCDPSEFIAENEVMTRLVFPSHLLDPILALSTTAELKTVSKEVHALYAGKRSGALLFSSAVKSIVLTEIDAIVAKGITLLTSKDIDETTYHAALAQTTKELDELAGKELVGKRDIVITYCGIELSTTVKSACFQAELSFLSVVRGNAARAEVLVGLPGESVVTTDSGSAVTVQKEMMVKANRARNTFLKAVKTLKKGDKPTGGNEIK
eukprot:934160-Amphidinium_carterae.7